MNGVNESKFAKENSNILPLLGNYIGTIRYCLEDQYKLAQYLNSLLSVQATNIIVRPYFIPFQSICIQIGTYNADGKSEAMELLCKTIERRTSGLFILGRNTDLESGTSATSDYARIPSDGFETLEAFGLTV